MLKFIAGEELWNELQVEKIASVPQNAAGLFESKALCALQAKQAQRGIVGAELVKSGYGWMVRYASGIQNFGVIAGGNFGSLNGWTYWTAEKFAEDWVAEDPAHRYAFVKV